MSGWINELNPHWCITSSKCEYRASLLLAPNVMSSQTITKRRSLRIGSIPDRALGRLWPQSVWSAFWIALPWLNIKYPSLIKIAKICRDVWAAFGAAFFQVLEKVERWDEKSGVAMETWRHGRLADWAVCAAGCHGGGGCWGGAGAGKWPLYQRVCRERPRACLGVFDPVYCFDMGKRVKESHSVQALHFRHLWVDARERTRAQLDLQRWHTALRK